MFTAEFLIQNTKELHSDKTYLQRQDGFTIIELLVSALITIIIVVAVFDVAISNLKNSRKVDLISVRNQVVTNVRKTVADQKAAIASLTKTQGEDRIRDNPEYFNCVCGIGTCTSVTESRPFTLYDSAGQLVSPAYYNANGSPCPPEDTKCIFKITTNFIAQCHPDLTSSNPNPIPTCNGKKAEFVSIGYTIEQNQEAPESSQGILMRSVSGRVFIQVADLDVAPGDCL